MKNQAIKNANSKNDVLSPMTLTKNVKLLKEYDAEDFAKIWREQLGIEIGYLFKNTPKFYLYECSVSRLRFYYPFEIAGDAALYDRLSEKNSWYYGTDKWEFLKGLEILQKAKARTVLEIGAGMGYFIKHASKLGFSPLGLEFNPHALVKAKLEGLPIADSTMKNLIADRRTFDAVVSFEVFEHVVSPREYVEESLRLLTPGGALIIAVPNRDSFIRHDKVYLDMPPHHMLSISSKFFEYLAQAFDLDLVATYFEPLAEYHIDYYLSIQDTRWRKVLPLWGAVRKVILPSLKWLLHFSTLRRLVKGQTMLAHFVKKINHDK
ncbi:MAG: class I SAM-dependent methyltransferase [Turneriella sp.]